jgi:CRISPR-associated protein Csd1
MQEIVQPNLNENYPDPAYQCGRLLAVLAELQRAALGDVSGGIIQRYYAAASITPTLVLGRLIRNSQFHLTKLQFGLARWFENKIIGITNNLKNGIPAAFSLEEQSLFALGYYQQMADLYTPKL